MVPAVAWEGLGNPLGLLALLALVPLIIVYLLRPDPRRYAIPTIRFLGLDTGDRRSNPVLDRLVRNLLLLIQVLVLLLIPLALAAPFVALPGTAPAGGTVVVLDSSASMATEFEDTTRFDRAIEIAGDEFEGTSAIVTTAPGSTNVATGASPAEARSALGTIDLSHEPGNLRQAISQATALVDDPAKIVVVSDFVDQTDWESAIESARLQGHEVVLRQVNNGGEDNVGIVGVSFTGTTVTATVVNFADDEQIRSLTLGEQSTELALGAGDSAQATFQVPPGGGELRLTPGDGFPLDDVVPIAAPDDTTISVLVVTNDENEFLTTALSVIGEIDHTVANPPVPDATGYDVIVFSNVDGDRLLQGTVRDAAATVDRDGGVIIQSQRDLAAIDYDDLLLIEPEFVAGATGVRPVADHRMIRGIDLVPAEGYVLGNRSAGESLAVADDGTPMLAIDDRDPGRVVYYGYIEEDSAFKFHFQYPVFWRNAVFYAAGHPRLTDLNTQTGTELRFDEPTSVQTPAGPVTATTVRLDRVGTYRTPDGPMGAGLLSPAESDVAAAPAVDEVADSPATVDIREPTSLAPILAMLAMAFVLLELAYLKRRGDL